MEEIGDNRLLFAPENKVNEPKLELQDDSYVASVSILVQLFMLGITFMVGHVLRRNKIMVVHEAGAALLLGVLVGMFVRLSGEARGFSAWIDFNNSFFFFFLLPPIILYPFTFLHIFSFMLMRESCNITRKFACLVSLAPSEFSDILRGGDI